MDEIDSFYRGKLLTLNAHSSDEQVKRIYDDVAEKYDKVCLTNVCTEWCNSSPFSSLFFVRIAMLKRLSQLLLIIKSTCYRQTVHSANEINFTENEDCGFVTVLVENRLRLENMRIAHLFTSSKGDWRGWLCSIQDLHSIIPPTSTRNKQWQNFRTENPGRWCWNWISWERSSWLRLQQHRRLRYFSEDAGRSQKAECLQEHVLCCVGRGTDSRHWKRPIRCCDMRWNPNSWTCKTSCFRWDRKNRKTRWTDSF